MNPVYAALVVVVVGGIFLFRRADVRLVLLLSAAVMFLVRATQPEVAGERWNAFSQFFTSFASKLVYAPAVIPICSAMGFAYVCKLTGCDAHLVHLLCRPLKYVRWLLIPGGIAVTFVVNAALVSQTSTVAVVGPVLIPLLLSAGVSRQTAGALLLLGGSMGGELLNPAAVEVAAIQRVIPMEAREIIRFIAPYNLLACGTALLVFWMMALVHERRLRLSPALLAREEGELPIAAGSMASSIASVRDCESMERINLFKAAVPLIPIVLLMFVKPWVEMPRILTREVTPIADQAAIAAAMLIGVACAGLSAPGRIGNLAATFFEGAGFAYAHIISVIAAAMTFADSITANELVEVMTRRVENAPTTVMVASILVPWLMATITGTAVGSAPMIIAILLPVAMGTVAENARTEHGLRIGAMNSIAAQYGRTNSPVAPVVIMSATLAQSRPLTMAKRVVIPLLAGGAMLFIAAVGQWFG